MENHLTCRKQNLAFLPVYMLAEDFKVLKKSVLSKPLMHKAMEGHWWILLKLLKEMLTQYHTYVRCKKKRMSEKNKKENKNVEREWWGRGEG